MAANSARAFIYKRGRVVELHTPEQAQDSRAVALNDRGEVVGTADFLPFVYSRGKFQKFDLSRFGGLFGEGVDINNSGQVLGNFGISHPEFGIRSRVFLATPITLMFSNLLHEVRYRDFRLAYKVAWAWFLYESEAHQPTCAALARFVSDVQSRENSKRLGGLLPARLAMEANTIRQALECATL